MWTGLDLVSCSTAPDDYNRYNYHHEPVEHVGQWPTRAVVEFLSPSSCLLLQTTTTSSSVAPSAVATSTEATSSTTTSTAAASSGTAASTEDGVRPTIKERAVDGQYHQYESTGLRLREHCGVREVSRQPGLVGSVLCRFLRRTVDAFPCSGLMYRHFS